MLRAMASDRNREERAARWLAAWDGQGIHRTATAGDEAGALWLAAEAEALGVAAAFEEVALDRLDPLAAGLDIAGERIPAVPVFDAPGTGPAGVEGRLGVEIAVAELTPRAVYSGEFERLRRAPGQRGFVVVCEGEAPGMGLINAESFRRPYGAPAIHVASEAQGRVRAALAERAPARLVAASRRT